MHTNKVPRSRLFIAGRFILGLSLLLFILPLACSEDDPSEPGIRDLADFLPPGTASMAKTGDPRLASDVAGLQDIVNGGFEDYTNNGFQEMIEQLYEGSVGGNAATVKVWIFDQGSSDNAEALHGELTLEGNWQNWTEVGDEADTSSSFLAYIILFRRDEYAIRLDINSSSQDAIDLLELFAAHIDQEITG